MTKVTFDLEQDTDRRAPKKMGRSAMNTRLPYASAVPSGVATNLAVALSASVPLESVAFRASRTAAAAAASGAEAGTGSASDMVLYSGGFKGTAGAAAETDRRIEVEGNSGVFVIHLPPRCCRTLGKATFPKAARREECRRRRSHSAVVSEDH